MSKSSRQLETQAAKRINYFSKSFLSFCLPSLLGVLLFIMPIPYGKSMSIPVAIMANFVEQGLKAYLPHIMTFVVFLAACLSIATKMFKPTFVKKSSYLSQLFDVSPFWTVVRVLGAAFSLMACFEFGSVLITSEQTGGLLLGSLLPILFSVFLFAGFLLPLLLDFGLLEFCGALFSPFMRPVFTLPGRSSIDCLASWMGDGTIGVVLTNKQYVDGYYTEREACVIGTTFSIVSVTFGIAVLSYVRLEHLIIPYYLTIALAGFIAAVVCPRIPPLSRKKDVYYKGRANKDSEKIPAGHSPLSWGVSKAVARAETSEGLTQFVKSGVKNVIDMWIGVVPVVMAFGTIGLVLAEHTPLFKYLAMPLVPVLELMQIPEAGEAAQTMIIGFADMFLPAVIASRIDSEMTRFIVASLSVTQLIYMSEVGGLLLGMKIPVNFIDLILIFIQRTLITLPVITLVAHCIF